MTRGPRTWSLSTRSWAALLLLVPAAGLAAPRVRAVPLISVEDACLVIRNVAQAAADDVRLGPDKGAESEGKVFRKATDLARSAGVEVANPADFARRASDCGWKPGRAPPTRGLVPRGVLQAASVAPGVSWDAALVGGLASLLSDRTEAELLSWMFDRFSQHLCSGTTVWFPSTCTVTAASDTYLAQNPGSMLAAALREDLEGVPPRALHRVMEAGARCDLDGGTPGALCAAVQAQGERAVLEAFAAIRHGQPPLEVLAGMGVVQRGGQTCEDQDIQDGKCDSAGEILSRECRYHPYGLGCSLASIGTVAAFLGEVRQERNLDDDAAVIASLAAILKFPQFQLSVKRLYHAPSSPPVSAPPLVRDIIGGDPRKLDGDAGQLVALYRAAYALHQRTRELSRDHALPALEKAAEVLSLVSDVVESAAPVIAAPEGKAGLHLQNMTLALRATSEMMRGRYPDGMRDVVVLVQSTHKVVELPVSVSRYLPLIVDLSSATSAAEAQTALAAAAAPVGSWRAKRSQFMVSITGYVGGAAGGEYAPKAPARRSAAGAGLTAMVGLDLQWPRNPRQPRRYGTDGIFLSLVDVGQLTWSRIGSDTRTLVGGSEVRAEIEAQAGLLQVLSPGAYYVHGFGGTPFTLGVGASLAPLVRKYTIANGSTDSTRRFSVLRYGLFIGADVTLFPFGGTRAPVDAGGSMRE